MEFSSPRILLLLRSYSFLRLPSIWGEDANEWNPERFLSDGHGGALVEKQMPMGVYANL